MDAAIARSFLFEHFIGTLKRQGYEVKLGKYIAVRPPGKERFVRLKTLGDNYTEEAIRQRIRAHERTPLYHRPPPPPKSRYAMRGKPKKLTGFRALCYRYLHLLCKLKKPTAPPRRSRYLMDEIIKFDRYVEQFKLLTKYRIDTEEQLHTLAEATQADLDALTRQRAELYRQKRKDPDNETFRKFDRYVEQFKLLTKYRIDTEVQLRTLEEAAQADLDALTRQRVELYRQKRKDPDNETFRSEIQSINRSIRGRRKELRICAQIEADIPTIRQKIHDPIPLPPKREKPPTKRKTRQPQR